MDDIDSDKNYLRQERIPFARSHNLALRSHCRNVDQRLGILHADLVKRNTVSIAILSRD